MKYGAVVMMDALGFKGAWKANPDAVLPKLKKIFAILKKNAAWYDELAAESRPQQKMTTGFTMLSVLSVR